MATFSKSIRPDTPAWRVAGVVGLSTLLMTSAWLLAALAWHDVPALRHRVPGPDDVVVVAAEVVGALVACWLSLGVLLTALAVLAGVRPVVPVLPASLRRLVVGLLGASTVVGVALPAQAATPLAAAAAAPTAAGVDPLDPGWVPSGGATPSPGRTTSPASPSPAARTPTHPRPTAAATTPSRHRATASAAQRSAPSRAHRSAGTTVVTVHRGDTLWDIARRQLEAGGHPAPVGEVARAWPRWFHANGAAIGQDPNHITPGTRLHRPASN